MSATDIKPSRLTIAKENAKKVVAAMEADDLAMVIAFSDGAKVISSYTGDRRLPGPTDRCDFTNRDLHLACAKPLQVAAGLANPSKQVGKALWPRSSSRPS